MFGDCTTLPPMQILKAIAQEGNIVPLTTVYRRFAMQDYGQKRTLYWIKEYMNLGFIRYVDENTLELFP